MLLPLLLLAAPAADTPPDRIVREFVSAYNKRRFEAFESALAPDAKWYSVEGGKISVEGEGAAALGVWVRNYLGKTCPSCRSELLSVTASGRFVSTVERASWRNAQGACLSQSGPAVYEVAEGRIRAVWYFPASAKSSC